MPFEVLEEMPDDELLAIWDEFAAHCERRAEAQRIETERARAAMPQKR